MDIIRIFVPEACEQEASPVGCCGPVPIGYVGESGVRQVVLDFSPWVETYGPGALTLMVRRNGDTNAYPVALEITGSVAAWTVSIIDTHFYGIGRAQYMYVVDGENAKSAIFQTFVDRSVSQPGADPPDPYDGWVQHLTELGAETLVNAQAAAGSAEAALAAKTAAETAQAAAAGSASDAATAKTAAETAQAAAEDAAESVSESADQIIQNAADISELKSAVFDWVPCNLKIAFAQGGFNSSGQAVASGSYARSSVWFDTVTTAYKIVPKNGCKLWAFYYTAPDLNNFDHRSDGFTSATTLEKGYYVRLVAGNTEGTAFSPAEGSRSFIAYEYILKAQDEDEIDAIDAICSNESETLKYAIGSNSAVINATDGSATSTSGYSRTDFVDISNFDYVVFSNVHYDASATQFGAAFYSDAAVNTFISGVCADILADVVSYKTKVVKVPDGAKYVRFTLMQSLDGFFAKGIRKKPLSGLYLSLLGDSMSAGDSNSPGGAMKTSAGGLYIPAGNDIYYNGSDSRSRVTNISEMWWKRLCDATGMIPLVIDAWSGSSICYNYAQNDSIHSDTNKIPMCSAMRTGRLSKDGHDPDIIIIAGGGNDWSYAAAASGSYRATTPIGNWDGHTPVNPTAIDSGDSTFMESYAYMIKRLRANYPHAIIVASTVWRSVGRGSFDPATPTETSEGLVLLNKVGNSTSDYSDAIAKVCKIMDVPLINVADIGITYENASTYAPDNPPTHTNPLGQAIIAKRYIEELPRLVKQFK